MIESEVSWAVASVLAIVTLVGTALTNITLQALHTITRPRVRQAIEEGNAGAHLTKIYQRRPATFAAVTAVLAIFLVTSPPSAMFTLSSRSLSTSRGSCGEPRSSSASSP